MTESESINACGRDPIIHIIYHDDPDGICAAAVVLFWIYTQNDHRSFRLYPTNYNKPVDISMMAPGDMVVIVDFSYPPSEMTKIEASISGTDDIRWIDHHKTAEAYGYQYSGLRDFSDKGLAGCELAWNYFFPDKALPPAVALIGDYDSWRMQLPDSKIFHEGIKMLAPNPSAPLWPGLLSGHQDTVDYVTAAGSIATQYRDAYCTRMRQSFGYETSIAGHVAYALNVYGFGSQAYGDLFSQYPLVIAYAHDGQRFTVSLYSETVDVGEIARSLGGGGHKGAAGFVCNVLPFFPVREA